MKRSIFIQALIFMTIFTVVASAQDDRIGIYANPDGTGNTIVIAPGQIVSAYVIAHVPSFPEGITGGEFGLTHWIEHDPVHGGVAVEIMGHTFDFLPPERIAIGWPDPQLPDENDNVLLARIDYVAIDPAWPGCNIVMETVGATWYWGQDESPRVSDPDWTMHYVDGDILTVNPATATASGTLSEIKALY